MNDGVSPSIAYLQRRAPRLNLSGAAEPFTRLAYSNNYSVFIETGSAMQNKTTRFESSLLYRLAWVAFLASTIANAQNVHAEAPPEPDNMVELFNGRDLAGWDGDSRLWSVRDGVIHGETTLENPARQNTFLIWKDGEVADFDLRLSFRIKTGNAGVQYRSKLLPEEEGNCWRITGYQAEVENRPGKAGFSYEERGRGRLAEVGEKVMIGKGGKIRIVGHVGMQYEIAETFRKGDWNDYVIIFRGNHLHQYLNGVQTVDVVDNDEKHSAAKGLLALQLHQGPPMWVEFKNVRLKQFPAAAK